jgi:hypothetical protein
MRPPRANALRGVQERSVIISFMTDEALNQFRRTARWKVGVDGSVVIVTVGAGGSIDTNTERTVARRGCGGWLDTEADLGSSRRRGFWREPTSSFGIHRLSSR